MIKLKRLAVFNASTSYARTLENGVIRQYHVSIAQTLTGRTADEIVIEHVSKETCDTVEIEAPRKINPNHNFANEAKDVLENIPKVRKQLEQRAVKSLVMEYNRKSPWWQYLFHPIVTPLNWLIVRINAKWAQYQWDKLGGFPESKFGSEGLFALRDKIKSIPTLPQASWFRCIEPCHFISIVFDESNRSKAIEIFQNDLKILAEKKLIMGHLAKPFTIELADITGSGEISHALACFLFVDSYKLKKIVGVEKYDQVEIDCLRLNKLLGLKTESFEGGLSEVDLRKKHTIEHVYTGKKQREADWDLYLKNCEDQQALLEKITKRNFELDKKELDKKANEYEKQKKEDLSNLDSKIDPSKINYDASTLISDKKD